MLYPMYFLIGPSSFSTSRIAFLHHFTPSLVATPLTFGALIPSFDLVAERRGCQSLVFYRVIGSPSITSIGFFCRRFLSPRSAFLPPLTLSFDGTPVTSVTWMRCGAKRRGCKSTALQPQHSQPLLLLHPSRFGLHPVITLPLLVMRDHTDDSSTPSFVVLEKGPWHKRRGFESLFVYSCAL